jgi:hypothetical protein
MLPPKFSRLLYYVVSILLLICFLAIRLYASGIIFFFNVFSYNIDIFFSISLVSDILCVIVFTIFKFYSNTQNKPKLFTVLEWLVLLCSLCLLFYLFLVILPHSARTCIRCPEEAVHIFYPQELSEMRTRDIFSYSYGTISILLHCWVYWKFRKPSKKLEN